MTQVLAVPEHHEELADLEKTLPLMAIEQIVSTLKMQIVQATRIENPVLFLQFLAKYTGLVLILVEGLHNFNNGEFAKVKDEFDKLNAKIDLTRDFFSTGQEGLGNQLKAEMLGLTKQMDGLAGQIKTERQILSGRIDSQVSEINKKLDLLLKQNMARAS